MSTRLIETSIQNWWWTAHLAAR
ncbi:trp operon leader peptide [Streptomyces sp. NPDC045714]